MTAVMPYLDLMRRTDFSIERYMAGNKTRGRHYDVVELADPRWLVRVTTGKLTKQEHHALRAWWDSLAGGLNDFHIYDVQKLLPGGLLSLNGLTRAAGGAFDGTATIDAFPTINSISLSGLPAGFSLLAGDYVGLVEGTARQVLRVVSAISANGAGVVTLDVAPHIETAVFTTAAVANFDKPVITVIPQNGSWQGEPDKGLSAAGFTAIQRLY